MAQHALHDALVTSLTTGHDPEALLTIAAQPLDEVARVAQTHRCESMLLGMAKLQEGAGSEHLERLLNTVDCDVALLRAPTGWDVDHAEHILVPVGGRGSQQWLRARLLGSLCRKAKRSITFLRIVPTHASDATRDEVWRQLTRFAEDEAPHQHRVLVPRSDDPVSTVIAHAQDSDLVVLGLQRVHGRKLFGEVALRIAQRISGAAIMLSRGG
jgi:hypothetical protein